MPFSGILSALIHCFIMFENIYMSTGDWLPLFLELEHSGHCTFSSQQMLKSCQGNEGSEKWFPWSPGADLPNTKHCFGSYVRNKIPSSGTLSPHPL